VLDALIAEADERTVDILYWRMGVRILGAFLWMERLPASPPPRPIASPLSPPMVIERSLDRHLVERQRATVA
jgi:hypothetical protein